jgi:SAM-dependent methyltransferase
MQPQTNSSLAAMKMLVVIASYGRKNDAYLARVLSEYRSMPCHTDIVVLSNLAKDLGPDVEVVVGLPTKHPMSLPFGHKRIFAERQTQYDLFLYTEDDMLITRANIEALLRVSAMLPPSELLGFFQWEKYPDGTKYFPAVHGHFHWVPESVKVVGKYKFAQFTNEHAACFLLTRSQLQQAIASGGFLVPPHEGKYTLLETATTDPYTQCGFRKVLCLSHFEDFLVAHLPNCYAGGVLGLDEPDFRAQMDLLQRVAGNGGLPKPLLEPETKLFHRAWSKRYYEPCREDLLTLLPANARNVLSIGCGWGATEASLIKKGIRVVGVPLDSVIAACAQQRGVEVVCGDLNGALAQLAGQQFDAILMPGVLHLLSDPRKALMDAIALLSDSGVLVASFPNVERLPFLWRRLRYPGRYTNFGDYRRGGMHAISKRRATQWFSQSGLRITKIKHTVPANWQRLVTRSRGLAAPLFSTEYVIAGHKTGEHSRSHLTTSKTIS